VVEITKGNYLADACTGVVLAKVTVFVITATIPTESGGPEKCETPTRAEEREWAGNDYFAHGSAAAATEAVVAVVTGADDASHRAIGMNRKCGDDREALSATNDGLVTSADASVQRCINGAGT
jgi:hypothetical protein